jgi:tetratricopeptide (TPR) repeat protein
LSQALEKNLNGPGLETAQALAFVAGNQADRSLAKLDEAVKREPKNGFLHLYKGWALTATNDPKGAAQSFDAALTADPNAKLPALYGRGRAKLLLLDLEAARADFSAILAIAKDHIGAQVGLAVAQSVSQQREADLLAVLARKDIAVGDPRAVVFAWTQAGDIARDSDRLDVARERYRQALTLSKQDTPALIGLARVELREGKVAQAAELVQKALGQRADDLEAMLTAAEVSLRQGKVEEALAMTSKLSARVSPVLPLQRARLQLVIGNVLESQSKDDEAIAAWMEGAKAAGDLDLAPMMAAVKKLGALAKKATDSHDESKAADYRARADELLSSLADRAHNDPQLSKALGAAYFGAGDFSKAEQLLRRAVEIRDSDIDARLALARVLVSLRRLDDALQQLHAAQALDASRLDVSLELARTLDGARRDADATAEYTKLIAQKEAPIQARIHAGRFLARKGDFKRASEQAEAILKAEPDNAAGHYLKGEGLIAANKLDDARRELTLAVETDPDPQYLDAQGRAAEASQIATGDTKYYDLALRAYERAIDADATMFNPQAGTGRVYVARREWSKAAAPLAAAIKIDPKSTEVMYNLGVTYKSLGHIPEAIEWLESVVRSKPDPDAYWQLAQLYQDNNRGRDTANALQQATRLARDKETSQGVKVEWLTEAWYRLGEIQLGLHNDAAAKAAYEMYVGRNPTPGAQLSEARRLLSTTLR